MKQGDALSLPKSWEMLTVGDVCERGSSNVSQNQLLVIGRDVQAGSINFVFCRMNLH